MILGIDAAIALILVPQGVLQVGRFKIDMDVELDVIVFLAVRTLLNA
jgi:hypothetical protein